MKVCSMSWVHMSSVSISIWTFSNKLSIFSMISLRRTHSSLCWCNFSWSWPYMSCLAVYLGAFAFIIFWFLILWMTCPFLQFTEKAVTCVLFVLFLFSCWGRNTSENLGWIYIEIFYSIQPSNNLLWYSQPMEQSCLKYGWTVQILYPWYTPWGTGLLEDLVCFRMLLEQFFNKIFILFLFLFSFYCEKRIHAKTIHQIQCQLFIGKYVCLNNTFFYV